MIAPKTKLQRQQDSAQALVKQREYEDREYARRQLLPTLEDKIRKLGEAINELAELIGGEDAAAIAVELAQYLEQETQ